jgi:type VI secretion system secreted protein VgrG
MAAVLVAFATVTTFGTQAAFAAPTAVGLGSASTYAILAGSAITNTGSSVIAGDIGLSPGTADSGFPPAVQSSGSTNVANAQALAAQTDLTAAYLNAAGQTTTSTVSGDLGGTTLTPGVYTSSSSLGLTGALTLNGGGNAGAVFILQAGSTLTTASGSSVVLENGAQACNVFWQVGSSATLGTTTSFVGTLMALTSITLNTGATVSGRMLARNGAVTLDDNTISVSTCAAVSPTTTTTVPSSTTTTVPSSTTTTVPSGTTTTTPVVPVGSPSTGFGGTAGPGPLPLGLIGAGAFGLAGIAGLLALSARRRQTHSSGVADSNSRGS